LKRIENYKRVAEMKKFEEFYNDIVKAKFNYGTGSWSVINPEIKTKMNEYGEYFPHIENIESFEISQSEFERIKKVTLLSDESPNENQISKKLFSSITDIKYNEKVGYYLNAYAGYVKEGDYRENASSGGFGTWIFKELLDRKLIDGVIHVKENKNSDDGILFNYGISSSIEEICEGAKTKYYPVEFSEALKYVKANPGRYAFIGVPSFVMSLRLLQELEPVLRERVIFTVGLICGHQKSAKYTEAIAWQCGIKPGDLEYINFRKKLKDAPPNNYIAELVGKVNGEKVTIVKNMKELIGTNWGQGFFKIKASDYTDDVMNETADVTLGDAWLPDFINDTKGNNVILTRNTIIDEIIIEGQKSDKISVKEMNINDIYKSQEAHYRHTREELTYRLYKRDKNKEWRPTKRVEAANSIPFLRARAQDLREEISTTSHEVYKKAVEKGDLNYYISNMNKLVKRYRNLYRIMAFRKRSVFKLIKKKIFR
jgi:coenzyme F420-reducing hydrogenase beta subunit